MVAGYYSFILAAQGLNLGPYTRWRNTLPLSYISQWKGLFFFNEQQRMHKPVSNVAIYLKTIDFSIINMHKKFACPQKSLDITLTNWSH